MKYSQEEFNKMKEGLESFLTLIDFKGSDVLKANLITRLKKKGHDGFTTHAIDGRKMIEITCKGTGTTMIVNDRHKLDNGLVYREIGSIAIMPEGIVTSQTGSFLSGVSKVLCNLEQDEVSFTPHAQEVMEEHSLVHNPFEWTAEEVALF